jgi:hypothetical protein
MAKSARTKACEITRQVKERVHERDGGISIISGKPGLPEAHFIPRSLGGLGIEENVVTLTREEHIEADQGQRTEWYKDKMSDYLKAQYPNFKNEDRIYKKGE